MSGWAEFVLAMAAFLLAHVIPVRPPARPFLVQYLGERGFQAIYSLLSLALLGWLIIAAARAPYVEVIPPVAALRYAPLVAMPLACWLAVAGMSVQNPLSFGGIGRADFAPDAPGILAISRHPLLLALILWSLAHLLANGGLAHVLLFGLFAGFAWLGMVLVDRRRRRELGDERWRRLSRNTPRLSLSGLRHVRVTWQQAGVAVIVFAVLLALHEPVIGFSPLP